MAQILDTVTVHQRFIAARFKIVARTAAGERASEISAIVRALGCWRRSPPSRR